MLPSVEAFECALWPDFAILACASSNDKKPHFDPRYHATLAITWRYHATLAITWNFPFTPLRPSSVLKVLTLALARWVLASCMVAPTIACRQRSGTRCKRIHKRNSDSPLALNSPESCPIFRNTLADFGDKVESRPLFRKLNKRVSKKFRGRKVWASAVAVAAQQRQQETIG